MYPLLWFCHSLKSLKIRGQKKTSHNLEARKSLKPWVWVPGTDVFMYSEHSPGEWMLTMKNKKIINFLESFSLFESDMVIDFCAKFYS